MFCNRLYDGQVRREEVTAAAFDRTVDILVAGLGCAGSIAAITAADTRRYTHILPLPRAISIRCMPRSPISSVQITFW